MEDENTQSAEITDTYGTSPMKGNSPPVFLHHEESVEGAETAVSDSTLATGESSRGTYRYPLWDHQLPNRYSWVGPFQLREERCNDSN